MKLIKLLLFTQLDPKQIKIQELMRSKDMNIITVLGPAGTGKTTVTCSEAVRQFNNKEIEKIVLTRPTVGVSGENLGFLPGDLEEKMLPWCRPLMDVLTEYYPQSRIKQLLDNSNIEISPLSYMRGRTFKKSIVILDEAQNTTPEQMKMFLTRIGEESKLVLTGDLDQSDIEKTNGLQDFVNRLKCHYSDNYYKMYVDGFATVRMTKIYRHPIIEKVIELY